MQQHCVGTHTQQHSIHIFTIITWYPGIVLCGKQVVKCFNLSLFLALIVMHSKVEPTWVLHRGFALCWHASQMWWLKGPSWLWYQSVQNQFKHDERDLSHTVQVRCILSIILKKTICTRDPGNVLAHTNRLTFVDVIKMSQHSCSIPQVYDNAAEICTGW